MKVAIVINNIEAEKLELLRKIFNFGEIDANFIVEGQNAPSPILKFMVMAMVDAKTEVPKGMPETRAFVVNDLNHSHAVFGELASLIREHIKNESETNNEAPTDDINRTACAPAQEAIRVAPPIAMRFEDLERVQEDVEATNEVLDNVVEEEPAEVSPVGDDEIVDEVRVTISTKTTPITNEMIDEIYNETSYTRGEINDFIARYSLTSVEQAIKIADLPKGVLTILERFL